MKTGIYLGRHASKFAGMAIYSKALALGIVLHCSKGDGGNDQVVLYGDRKILDSDFFQELDQLGILYNVVEYDLLGCSKKTSEVSPDSGSDRISVCLLPEVGGHKLSILLDMIFLPPIAKRHRLGLLHSTCNYGFVLGPCPQVVTVHDLFQAYPDYCGSIGPKRNGLSWSLARLFFRGLFFAQFKKIGHFITDIREVATELQKRYRVMPDRITTITLGLDEVFVSYFKENDFIQRRLNAEAWCQNHNLKPDFVLLFGSLDARKNFERQLVAYRELDPVGRPELAIVGNNPGIRKVVDDVFSGEENIRRQGINFIPNVPRIEVPQMLEAAAVVLNATLAEGFGLPAYEALAMGARVVTGSLESLIGVDRDCSFFCEPSDQKSLNRALSAAVKDFNDFRQSDKRKLPGLGFKTMSDVAQETYNLYSKICDNQ